jgi:DNA-binding MarR family transcriptional regulator
MTADTIRDARTLESLLPKVISTLFGNAGEDPLHLFAVGQVRVMRALFESGPLSASEVGETLRLSPSSVTQIAGRLIKSGLVEKQHDPRDGRLRMLSLTSEGRTQMAARQLRRAEAAAQVLQTLPTSSRALLIDCLTELTEAPRAGAKSK